MLEGMLQEQVDFYQLNPGKLGRALTQGVADYSDVSVYVGGSFYEQLEDHLTFAHLQGYLDEQVAHGVERIVLLDRFGRIIVKHGIPEHQAKIEIWFLALDTRKGLQLKPFTNEQALIDYLRQFYENVPEDNTDSEVFLELLPKSDAPFQIEWGSIEII